MKRAIVLTLLFIFPSILRAGVMKWEGKPISVSISAERLTRIEFPESLRSAFLSRSDIILEKEDRSLYVRALAPDVQDALFVVGESGTTYELNLSVSDNPDQTVVISSIPGSFLVEAERARPVPALDLLRSMMRGLAVNGYEIIKADKKEVYRDAVFSMKHVEVYRSPLLHGYVIEVENLAGFPVLLRVEEIDFAGMVGFAPHYIQGDSIKSGRRRYRGEIYDVILGWVAVYVHRLFASFDPLHLFHKELAVEDDPSIGRPKMLQIASCYVPLRHHRHVVLAVGRVRDELTGFIHSRYIEEGNRFLRG